MIEALQKEYLLMKKMLKKCNVIVLEIEVVLPDGTCVLLS